jgi:hypothetical protein
MAFVNHAIVSGDEQRSRWTPASGKGEVDMTSEFEYPASGEVDDYGGTGPEEWVFDQFRNRKLRWGLNDSRLSELTSGGF